MIALRQMHTVPIPLWIVKWVLAYVMLGTTSVVPAVEKVSDHISSITHLTPL